MNIFTLFGTILVDHAKAVESIHKVGSAADQIATTIAGGVGQIGSFCTNIGEAVAGVGTKMSLAVTTPLMGIGAAAINAGKNFESSMSQVAATMGMSADEVRNGSETFKMLEDAAKDAGATTAFSASEAAEALNYLALAGYSAEQSAETLPTVLNLAAAGGMELAAASDMVTDSMSALGMSTDQVSMFADQLAKTSQKSNTSVAQLGEGILTVGGTAQALSGGVTELNTCLGILADNGIKGAEGGTVLRNTILSLSAPTDKAAGALKELGVETVDAGGNLRSLEDIMKDINIATADMGSAEKAGVLNNIFNKTDLKGINALLAATEESVAGAGNRFQELGGYIDEAAGACQQMADTQLDNLEGKITILKSGLEAVGVVIYQALLPKLEAMVELIQGVIEKFLALEPAQQQFIIAIGLVVAAIGPLLVIGGKLIAGIGTICTTVSTLIGAFTSGGAAVTAFSTVIGFLASPIGIAIAAITGLIAIMVTLYNTNEEVREKINVVWENIKELFQVTCDLIMSIVNGFIETFKAIWNAYGQEITEIISVAWNYIKDMISNTLDIINGFIDIFKNVFTGNWKGVWQSVKDIASSIWELIKDNLKNFLDLLITIIVNVGLSFLDAGAQLWNKFWEGCKSVWNNITDWINKVKEDPVKAFMDLGSKMYNAGKKLFTSLWDGAISVWNGICNWVNEKIDWLTDKVTFWNNNRDKINGSHAGGINEIPFDNYVALLHKGERVLTASENNKLKSGGFNTNSNSNIYNITIDSRNVKEFNDIINICSNARMTSRMI